ncbi:MAG TPA: hypothetical protein P5123_13495 [Spirochaetota bacterium]|nr:hypothetical protein [Spirochaetota bacterium]
MIKKPINSILEHTTSVANGRFTIFVVIIAALIIPSHPILKTVLPWILGCVMFVNFITIKIKITNPLNRTGIAYFVVVAAIIPCAIALSNPGLPAAVQNGLILAIISPTALSSPVIASFTGADSSRLVTHILIAHIAAPVIYTIHLYYSLNLSDFTIPYFMIILKVVTMILAPLIAACLYKKTLKNIAIPRLVLMKKILFYLLVFTAVSSASEKIKNLEPLFALQLFITVFLLAVLLYFCGYITCYRQNKGITGALMFGHKNTGLSLWLAITYLPGESSAPLVLYIISHHIINGILISFNNKNPNLN